LAFVRCLGDQAILVVANLSRFVQGVRLDLAAYAGCLPEDAFGGATLPPIERRPYFLTLGPHGFYWFVLKRPEGEIPEPR